MWRRKKRKVKRMDSGLATRSANTNSSGRVPAMCTCFRSVRIHGRKRLEFSDPLVMFGQFVSLFPPRQDVINCRLKMMDGRKRIFFNQTSHSLEKNQKHPLICCQKRLITILLFVLSKECLIAPTAMSYLLGGNNPHLRVEAECQRLWL